MYACENCDWKGTEPDGFRQSFNDWAGYQDECSVVILPAGSCPKCQAPVYRDDAHAAMKLAKAAPDMLAALQATIALLNDGGDVQVLPGDIAQDIRAAITKAQPVPPPPKKRPLHCACCGGYAGEWVQWWNQDTGHGLCASCRLWLETPRAVKGPRVSPEDMRRTYGEPGVHYPAPGPDDQSRSSSGSPSSTSPK